MMGDEDGGGGVAPTFIKKRTKPRGSAAISTASLRTSLLRSNEQHDEVNGEEDGQGEEVAVQRTAGIGSRGKRGLGKAKKLRTPVSSALSFGDDGEEPAFELKRSALAQASRTMKSVADVGEAKDQADITITSNGYSASALAALKASTPARRRVKEEDGHLDSAHKDMIDPSTQTDEFGNNLSRMKFGADFAHDGIPSEALVMAAKERRRRVAEGVEEIGPGVDFISLREDHRDQGPHPESRLQREEDDLGSGEEEFAEFTGATERVALGQSAIKQAKIREREEKREAMDLDDDSNDSGQEWERAQMGRIEGISSRKQREKREKSPFRPASIPLTAPLPTLNSTSARLASKVEALNSSIKNHGQVIDDAVRQLQQLEGDEKRNKSDIEVAGDKEAWFRELEEFIISLSTFLDDKMPRLEEIEKDWRDLLSERAYMVERARADTMTDEACLFHGVPAKSLLPRRKIIPEQEVTEEEDSPEKDGGALSVVRETRRTTANQYETGLPPADEAAFEIAQKDIKRRLGQLLDDVKAPEFVDPAIRIDSKLHPSSLVVRFHQWRALYPEEYASAWGGLTLAGIWDFWVRKELSCWDIPKAGHYSLTEFQWHKELLRYSAVAGSSKKMDGEDQTGDESMADVIGGDEEVISHVICNTFINRIIDVCEAGAFDPWSIMDVKSMTEVLEQVSYVLERDNSRFQSLATSFLNTFKSHIDTLLEGMTGPPVISPPPFDPRGPPALLTFQNRVKNLLFNLLQLNRYVPPSERPYYLDLIDRLVGELICNLLIKAKESGAKEIAQEILQRCGRMNVLREDVRARLTALG